MGEHERTHCMDHSGMVTEINTLKADVSEIFKRLREVEMTVWKAAGASGVICGLITSIAVAVLGRHL